MLKPSLFAAFLIVLSCAAASAESCYREGGVTYCDDDQGTTACQQDGDTIYCDRD